MGEFLQSWGRQKNPVTQFVGCPPGIRTPIGCSRGSCPTIERGGNKTQLDLSQGRIGEGQSKASDTEAQLIHDKVIRLHGQTKPARGVKATLRPLVPSSLRSYSSRNTSRGRSPRMR